MLLSEPSFVEFLKNDVIPSWENVRDPIKVELDMGDGRTVHRTIGGNTVMYLVGPNGYVVDAFPGVYQAQDILPDVKKAVSLSAERTEDWIAYHRPPMPAPRGPFGANVGKTLVEAPVLEALGEGQPFRSFLDVVDESHIPRTREQSRQFVNALPGSSDQEAADVAVLTDSRNNVANLRPRVHGLLSARLRTVENLKLIMFKDLLGVPIDDPNFGLTNVLTPGGG